MFTAFKNSKAASLYSNSGHVILDNTLNTLFKNYPASCSIQRSCHGYKAANVFQVSSVWDVWIPFIQPHRQRWVNDSWGNWKAWMDVKLNQEMSSCATRYPFLWWKEGHVGQWDVNCVALDYADCTCKHACQQMCEHSHKWKSIYRIESINIYRNRPTSSVACVTLCQVKPKRSAWLSTTEGTWQNMFLMSLNWPFDITLGHVVGLHPHFLPTKLDQNSCLKPEADSCVEIEKSRKISPRSVFWQAGEEPLKQHSDHHLFQTNQSEVSTDLGGADETKIVHMWHYRTFKLVCLIQLTCLNWGKYLHWFVKHETFSAGLN